LRRRDSPAKGGMMNLEGRDTTPDEKWAKRNDRALDLG
jgi:hypothetical protein